MSFLPHSLPPAPVFGVRAQIRRAVGSPKGAAQSAAAKLVSDPNNREGSQQPYLALSLKRGRASVRFGPLEFLKLRHMALPVSKLTSPSCFVFTQRAVARVRVSLKDKAKYGCWLPFPPRRGWKGAGGIGGEDKPIEKPSPKQNTPQNPNKPKKTDQLEKAAIPVCARPKISA